MQLGATAVGRGDVVRARAGTVRAAACSRWRSSPASCWRGASCRRLATTSAGNPANAFFYVLTALHGLHLIGGLVVLGPDDGASCRAAVRSSVDLRLSVELCAMYWHFLLLVWLVLFALLLNT